MSNLITNNFVVQSKQNPTGGTSELPNRSPSQNFPCKRSRDRHRMSGQSAELPQYTLRVMEDAELSQYRRPVVTDSFPGKTIIGTERIDSAKRDFDSPPC